MAEAFKDWRWPDTALLGAALAATYADTETTKPVLTKPGWSESNPLVGQHPSGSDLDKAALTAGVIGTGIASFLPPKRRRQFLGAWAGLEAGIAKDNAEIARTGKKPARNFEMIPLEPVPLAIIGGLLAGQTVDDGPRYITPTYGTDRDKQGRASPRFGVAFGTKFAKGGPVRGFGRIGNKDRMYYRGMFKKPRGFARLTQKAG